MITTNTRKINLDNIIITPAFKATLPKADKIRECYANYLATNRLNREIVIDGENGLIDGYVAYLIAKMVGMERVEVLQVSEKQDKPFVPCDSEGGTSKSAPSIPNPCSEPSEPKEPIKLYCVKDYNPGKWYTKGKVYDVAPCTKDGYFGFKYQFRADDGYIVSYNYLSEFQTDDTTMSSFLVPLVKRPAKVGEYIVPLYAECCHIPEVNKNDIHRVTNEWRDIVWTDKDNAFEHSEYLVLDGFKGESL